MRKRKRKWKRRNMEEQNKMDELFKLMGFEEKERISDLSRKAAMKHLGHKLYQNDFGGKDYDE